ncbi:LOW QUALITY PROTEIN: putative HOS3-like histone deacetylase [Bipolaris maydis]|nr:LOW QUALITY PROTEIN: putative HOS3-like histone deacetylase [Bipolaris maydis]
MQSQRHPSPAAAPSPPRPARQTTTNNDANLLSLPLKRRSLQTATNMPLPQPQPQPHSPAALNPTPPRRAPSTPNFKATPSLQRSPSSSTSSLRGDAPRASVSRRASFNPMMQSPMPKSPLATSYKPPLRACDVALDFFKKELARHEGITGAVNAGTVVIVHDQCYGHRFSRPRTAKSTLSLIMERPERILASVLAYVRLGERHADGSHPPHPHHNPPDRVPFKIRKTSRAVDITSPVVTNWMNELKSLCDDAETKLASTGKELARDSPAASKKELHAGDLYLCPESLNAFQGALGGVLDAVDAVFQGTSSGEGPSRAFVCIRPPGHHCSDDFPSGFCWINNHAIMTYNLTHAAIIDFDLHHGDGSQAIAWARNKKNTPNWKKTSIGYFSLHDINSYPCEDGDDDKSIWNPWKTFWAIYEEKYMTRQYLRYHTNRLRTSPNHPAPKAAIFLSAGFDASMQRHSVNVPTEFYARFTRDVEEGTSVQGRVISVLEGGYSDRALTSGVMSHLSDGQLATGLASSVRDRLGALSVDDQHSVETEATPLGYDPFWWHSTHLTELENLVNPAPLAKPPPGPNAHFSSPTQSFVAKLTRNLSAKYASSPSRAPTPPPPEVDWATAAQALSSLHKPEDLMEVKVKKEKPAQPALTSVHSGRQLRGRKAAPSYVEHEKSHQKESRATSSEAPPAPSASRRMRDRKSSSREPSVATSRSAVAPSTAPAGLKKTAAAAAAAARAPQRPSAPRAQSNYSSTNAALKGKDNDDMPSKEEHDAREKEREEKLKAAEAPKKTGTRKAPAARAAPAKPAAKATSTAKKGTGRALKSSKVTSPQESKASTPVPDDPYVQAAAAATLQQPQPVSSQSASGLVQNGTRQSPDGTQVPDRALGADRRISGGIVQPPTELHDMTITPEQIREHLPMPSFVTVAEPLINASPPSRADTPPPPPPTSMPQFVNYTTESFGTAPSFAASSNVSDPQASATLQWVANTHAETTDMAAMTPMSPPSKRSDLPVFTANGAIPFASSADGSGQTGSRKGWGAR